MKKCLMNNYHELYDYDKVILAKTTPTEHEFRTIFERLFETESGKDRQESTKKESMKLNDFLQTHPGSSVQSVAEASLIPQTDRIMD